MKGGAWKETGTCDRMYTEVKGARETRGGGGMGKKTRWRELAQQMLINYYNTVFYHTLLYCIALETRVYPSTV